MKLLLLSLTFAVFTSNNLGAQSCTPGTNFADSLYGVWPSPSVGFPMATVNVAYSTDINFKVPDAIDDELVAVVPDAALLNGNAIISFKLLNVSGLPAGITHACNLSNCEYLGGANGCARLQGTSSSVGSYPVVLEVSVLVESLFGNIPLTIPFDGYTIEVGVAGTIEQIISPISVSPNPANNEIKIEGLTASMKANQISILNIEGKVVAEREIKDVLNTTFDLSAVKAGIYFVNVSHASGNKTVKFIKQ